MKLLKNKFFVGTVCIILGLVVGFIVIPQVQAGSQNTYVTAIRVKQDVPVGTQLTTPMLEGVRVPKDAVPSDAISEISMVSSQYTAIQMYAGDYITLEKITDKLKNQDPLIAATTKGMRVMSIPLSSLASGVSGKLQPGDIVTVLAYMKNSIPDRSLELDSQTSDASNPPAPQTIIYPELQYVEVCAVSASDGSNADVEDTPSGSDKNKLPVSITLYVTEEQALRLADLEQNAVIQLAFVARGRDAVQFIPDARRILNTEVQ
jgi:pilus assembly protein CpaB